MSQAQQSNAPSKAESTASQLEFKTKANEIKKKLRFLLKNLDTGKPNLNSSALLSVFQQKI